MDAQPQKPQKVQQQWFRSAIVLGALAVLAFFGFLAATIAVVLLLLKSDSVAPANAALNGKNGTVCRTPDCVTLAYQLHNWADRSVDPCVDFHQFACGRYAEFFSGPGPVTDKMQSMLRLLKKFLESSTPSSSNTENIMRKVYAQCVERSAPNFDPTSLAIDSFQEILGYTTFPWMKSGWQEGDFDINEALKMMAAIGMTDFGLFSIEFSGVGNRKIIYIKPPAKQDLLPAQMIPVVKWYLKVNGQPITDQKFDADLSAAQNHLNYLANFHKITGPGSFLLSDLETKIPFIKWSEIFNYILGPNVNVDHLFVVFPYDIFFANPPDLQKGLSQIWTKEQTANMLFVKLWNSLSFGVNGAPDCTMFVMSYMPRAALRYFTRNYVKKENRDAMSELIEDVRNSYIDIFKKNTWMDESTRKAAIEKAEKMTKIVGYGEEYEPEGTLDAMYDDFIASGHLQKSAFHVFLNVLYLRAEHAMEYMMSDSLFDPFMGIFQPNAFYSLRFNCFIIMMPFLDEPFFDISFPKYAKLAGIGQFIAHEIGHGYDDKGRMAGADGADTNWWTPGDTQKYEQKAQCLRDQYNNYLDPDIGPMNGDQTIGENIADLIGNKAAWNSYQYSKSVENEQRLFGFEDYPVDKLFWQISALTWCEHRSNLEQLRAHVAIDTHAVPKFRVNGVYQNMPGFSEAFNCPVGSPMNPANKCELF